VGVAYMLPTKEGVKASCVALPAGRWATLLEFLVQRFPVVGEEEWRLRFLRGDIRNAHNLSLDCHYPFKSGEKIYYYRHVQDEPVIPFKSQVIFQDDYLVVADKPHFLPVVPSGRYAKETLLARLTRELGIDTLAPMHRIDKDTAGLVLFTVQPSTRNAYQKLFRDKQVEKIYHAVAAMNERLRFPMHFHCRLQQSDNFMLMQRVEGPANADTWIDLIERRGSAALYELKPGTGLKHQLRVQMASLGIPIVNDSFYPVLQPQQEASAGFARPLQLLAKSIQFVDPISGQIRRFESRLEL